MTFFSTAARAVRLGREFASATDAFLRAVEDERPLREAVRAFAAETQNELDDQAAEVLIAGLSQAIDAAQTVAHLAAVWGPTIADWGVHALKLENRLRKLRG